MSSAALKEYMWRHNQVRKARKDVSDFAQLKDKAARHLGDELGLTDMVDGEIITVILVYGPVELHFRLTYFTNSGWYVELLKEKVGDIER